MNPMNHEDESPRQFPVPLIGLFALSSVFTLVEKSADMPAPLKALPSVSGQIGLMRPYFGTLVRSTVLGFLVSVSPGHGATISAFISYGFQKRISKRPETFGHGNPEGLISSEAAANASVPGALAPMLALGIPGSASTAVLIGALTLHGVQPGPLLFVRNPEIPFSIFIAMIVTMPFMVALGLAGTRLWIRVTQVPRGMIAGLVGAMCLLGSYASQNDIFAVWTTIVFGILGYVLHKARIHPAPIVLALVLGNLTESNFRRSLITSRGDPAIFFTHPLGVACLLVALAVFVAPLLRRAPVARPAAH